MYSRQFTQFILGLVFLVSSSFAFSNTEFTYHNNGEGITISGCVNICPLNLVIPNLLDDLPVTEIGYHAFHNNHLTSVFLPNSLTNIGAGAFRENNLTEIVIPDGVKTIGWLAFQGNKIEAVSLPSDLERIEDGVFYGNQLFSVVIPDKVTFIGVNAFRDNEINIITLSNNLMLISNEAFAGNNITDLTIPSSVISINDRAFSGNPFENITFMGDRPEIGKDAFALTNEIDESYWGTTYQNCSDENSNDSLNCDTFHKAYTLGEERVNLAFCENTSGWPGESLHIEDIHEYNSCNDLIPLVCEENWTKFLAIPQEISDCPLNTSQPLNAVINYSVFDLDQNGSFDALTDALILLRYAFGLRGDNLTTGAVAFDATRTSAAEIEAHIESHMP